jgi:hypothetical protein
MNTFLSRDPVEGVSDRFMSRNGYSYAEANPVNYTDPSGNCPMCFVVGAGILLGGLFYAADQPAAVATADWILNYSGTYDLLDEGNYITRVISKEWFGYSDGLPMVRGQIKEPLRNRLLTPYKDNARYQQVRDDLEPWGGLVTIATMLNGLRSIPNMINGLGSAFSIARGGAGAAQFIGGGTLALQEALAVSISWVQVAAAARGAVGVASGLTTLNGFGSNILTANTPNPNFTGVPKPKVSDPELSDMIDELYRPGATYGPTGSTADAIRFEKATGQLVGGKSHLQKGRNAYRWFREWFNSRFDGHNWYAKGLNPYNENGISPDDLKSAIEVYLDLIDAIGIKIK